MTDAITQLAQEQAAITTQPGQQPVQQVSNLPPADVKNIPASSQPVQPTMPSGHVPYDRFKAVVEERNQLLQMISQAAAQPQSVTQPQQPIADPYVNMTAEQFAKTIEQRVDAKLTEAYQQKVAPISDYVANMQFTTRVENYFADPEKAKLRADMDAYTATLTPYEQQTIKQSVLNGNTRRLDEIYYTVANERQRQVQGLTNQQVQQTINQATSPQGYRTINNVAPTFQDKLAQASQEGVQSDKWLGVMREVYEGSK